jgi:hypothetical protein
MTQKPDGMTMRQWYAGQIRMAMGNWTPDFVPPWNEEEKLPFSLRSREWLAAASKARAEWAFAEADAMIAAEKET